MPIVEAPRDERVNLRLSSSASEDLRWLAGKLGVPKSVAAAVAIAIGVKTLQRHMAITPAEVEQLLVASGGLQLEAVDPAPVAVAPAPVAVAAPVTSSSARQGKAVAKGKRRH